MKKIFNYIAVVTASALLAPSCSTDGVDNIPEGQGLITMNVETGTRAAGVPLALDECTVGIYDLNQGEALVRKYAKGHCPDQIALVAGDYRVKVQYGEKPAFASFDNCYYEGLSRDISLRAGATETANVTCLPQSVAVEVHFGDNFAEIFNSYATDVTLGNVVTNGSLRYTENRTGYFTLPEGVTMMTWTFTGDHKTKGTITKAMPFAVEAGKKYALGFKFSADMPGYIDSDVIILEIGQAVEWDDEFNFSNDPEITSPTNSSFFFDPQVYAGEAMTVQVAAQAEITKLSVEAAGKTFDLITPADDKVTAVFDTSRMGATVTLNPSFFDFACGDMPVTFKVEDADGGQGEKTATIRMAEGIMPVAEADYNLWTNSVTLHAKSNGTAAPVFKLRTAGQTEWQTVNGTLDGDEYVAVMNPEWISSQNENGLTVYSPKENRGVWAGGLYEAMVEFGGRISKTSFSTRGGDAIPNGDMENTGASCYTQSNSDESSVIWGSGNNFMTKTLCQPARFDGMGGTNCSVLTATQTAGNLAAGNLFLGTFTMDGANGTVDFGIRYGWTARPKGLRFKYHATVGAVNVNKYNGPLAKGEQDQISIYFAILNWSSRHGVTSGVSAPSGIWSVDAQSNLEGSGPIIAYGTMVIDTSTAGNTMVEGYIPINFYDTAAGIPDATYTLTIACSTSRYGDYMNGCDKNVLYVDDFEWVY